MSKQPLPNGAIPRYYTANDLSTEDPGPVFEAFINAPRSSGFTNNAGAVALYNARDENFPVMPKAIASSPAIGFSIDSTFGHSERRGMSYLLNKLIPLSNKEIERPDYYYNSPSLAARDGERLQSLMVNAPRYKTYLERTNPNSVVKMWSDRPLCTNTAAPGGTCSDFNNSILPNGSSYGHISRSNNTDIIEASYNKMREAYLRRPWMQQPQAAAAPQAAPQPVTPSLVPRSDVSSFAGSGYNPYSSTPTAPNLSNSTSLYYPQSISSSSSPYSSYPSSSISFSSISMQNPYNSSSSISSGSYPDSNSSSSSGISYNPYTSSSSNVTSMGSMYSYPNSSSSYNTPSLSRENSDPIIIRSRSRSYSPERKVPYVPQQSAPLTQQRLPLNPVQRALMAQNRRAALEIRGTKGFTTQNPPR